MLSSESSLSRHLKRCLSDIPALPRRKACKKCSASKTRCNLGRPECSRCLSSGIQCEYDRSTSDDDQSGSSLNLARLQSRYAIVDLPTPSTEDNSVDFNPFACPPHREMWSDVLGRSNYPTLGSEPGSVVVVTFVLRVLKTYPRMCESGRPPPFIHPSHLGKGTRTPLENCIRVLSGLKDSTLRNDPIIHQDASNEIIALLAGVSLPR